MCLATSNKLLLMPAVGCKKTLFSFLFFLFFFFFFSPRTRDLLVSRKTMQRHFFPTIHHLSRVILAATTVVFVFLGNSKLKFHCYTQREKQRLPRNRPGSDSCDLSRRLARKITKGIHSRKPASLNRLIDMAIKQTLKQELLLALCRFVGDKGDYPEIYCFCLVLLNSVLLKLSCVWT